jgi:hypothetical protein
VRQTIALFGAARFGAIGYIVLSLLGTLLFAVPSWHLVERHAIRLKNFSLTARRQRVTDRGYDPDPRGPGATGAVPDATVLEATVLEATILEATVVDAPVREATVLDVAVLDVAVLDVAVLGDAEIDAAGADAAEIQEQTRRRAQRETLSGGASDRR